MRARLPLARAPAPCFAAAQRAKPNAPAAGQGADHLPNGNGDRALQRALHRGGQGRRMLDLLLERDARLSGTRLLLAVPRERLQEKGRRHAHGRRHAGVNGHGFGRPVRPAEVREARAAFARGRAGVSGHDRPRAGLGSMPWLRAHPATLLPPQARRHAQRPQPGPQSPAHCTEAAPRDKHLRSIGTEHCPLLPRPGDPGSGGPSLWARPFHEQGLGPYLGCCCFRARPRGAKVSAGRLPPRDS